jgi:hypothetical protein
MAATEEASCWACPEVSTSSADRTSCQCNVGYTSSACIACVAGTNSECTDCDTGDAGSACIACVAGTYHEPAFTGSYTCIDCGAGKYSATIAATAEASCSYCLGVSTVSANRTSCQCNTGYTGSACDACVAGTFKSSTGSVACTACPGGSTSSDDRTSCTDCGAGKYSATMAAPACSDCPGFSTSSGDRTWCQCNAGYGGTVCDACAACKYKSVPVAAVTYGGTNCGFGCNMMRRRTLWMHTLETWGTISDGPGDYLNYANCWWLIETTLGVEIKLNFLAFDTKLNRDFVKICSAPTCGSVSELVRASGAVYSSANFYRSATGYMRAVPNQIPSLESGVQLLDNFHVDSEPNFWTSSSPQKRTAL